jgi:hypothetical protein
MIHFAIPSALTMTRWAPNHIRSLSRNGTPVNYGCQPFMNLSAWVCFTHEVEDWMSENMRRKSGIRLRLGPQCSEDAIYASTNYDRDYRVLDEWAKSLHPPQNYIVFFSHDSDGMLFKLKWF